MSLLHTLAKRIKNRTPGKTGYAILCAEKELAMIKRTCGACSACCFTHPIKEIGKEAGAWCRKCNTAQSGCTIYKKRPQPCKDFRCAWLDGIIREDDDRPDRAGIVVNILALNIQPYTLWHLFEYIHGGLSKDTAKRVRAFAQENLHAVLEVPLRSSPRKPVLYAPRECRGFFGHTILLDTGAAASIIVY